MGDIIEGQICSFKDGECYFVFFKVVVINFDDFEKVCYKVYFDNFILFYLDEWFYMELLDLIESKDYSFCVIDLVVLFGKG